VIIRALRRLFAESFLPLLLVLLGVLGTTLYLDRLARDYAVRPTRVQVQPTLGTWDESQLSDDGLAGPRGSALTDPTDTRPELVEVRRLARAGDVAQALATAEKALASTPDDAVLTNEVAVLLLKSKQVDRAVESLSALVARRPDFHRAWFNLGLARGQRGELQEARAAYERAIALMPNHLESHVNLGMLLLDLGDAPGAVTVLEKATHFGGGDEKARAYFSYGVALGRAGRRDDAMAAYMKAIEFRPDYLLPRYNQAQLLMADKTPERLDEAERILRQTIALGPEFAPAFFLLGRLASARDRDEEALEHYERAVQHAPNFFKAAYNAALIALRLKRTDDAARGFQRLVVAFPDRAEPHFNLGRIAYQRRRYDEAERAYRKAIELQKGEYPEAELNLGLALKAAGRKEDALALFDALSTRHPEMASARQNRAVVLMALNRDDEARAELTRAAAGDRQSASAHYNLGVLEARQGRHAEAAAAYERALAAEEDHLKAAINLGVERAALGDKDAAIKAYERAIAIAPDYAPAWFNLGVALRAAGRLGEAADAYRKVLALDPESVKAMTNLGATYAKQSLFELAIRAYRDALEIAPRNASARYNLALTYKRAGRVDEALAELERARTLSPTHARTANLLATIHLERRAFREAADVLAPFESSPRARVSLLRTLTAAHIELGHVDAAAALLRRVQDRAPSDPETLKLVDRLAAARKGAR